MPSCLLDTTATTTPPAPTTDPALTSDSTLQFKSLFRLPQLRRTLLLLLLWPVTALGYYGLALSMSDLGSSAFLSNALAALVEIPAILGLVLTMDLTGRRPLLTCRQHRNYSTVFRTPCLQPGADGRGLPGRGLHRPARPDSRRPLRQVLRCGKLRSSVGGGGAGRG